MYKKFLSVFVMVAMILAIIIPTFATSGFSTGDVLGERKSLEEQLASLPPERQEQLLAKVNRQRELPVNQMERLGAYWNIVNSFEGYTQEADNYCLIACCQAVIQCVAGIYYSQNVIASDIGLNSIGVPFPNAVTYLNGAQSTWAFYHEVSTSSYDNMMSDFLFSIRCDVPVIVSTIFSQVDGWLYSATIGHSMVAYGIKSDVSEIALSDPFLVRLSNRNSYDEYDYTTPYYDMDSYLVYDAIVERGNGYIY